MMAFPDGNALNSYLQPHLKLANDPVPLSPRIDGHDSRSPLKEKEKE